MIDWDAEDWGGRVHLAANGSWVADRHGDEVDEELRSLPRPVEHR